MPELFRDLLPERDWLTTCFSEQSLDREIMAMDLTEAPGHIRLHGNFAKGNKLYLSKEMLRRLKDGSGSSIIVFSNSDLQQRPVTGMVVCLVGAFGGEWKVRTDHTGLTFVVGDSVWASCEVTASNNSSMFVGDNVSMSLFGPALCRCSLDNSEIRIGTDCMFADDVVLQSVNSHAMFDCETLEVLNGDRSEIAVGAHVWLERRVSILPNVNIGDGSIIGCGSTVTGNIGPRSLAIGVPAKTIRRNVTWARTPGCVDTEAREFLARFPA